MNENRDAIIKNIQEKSREIERITRKLQEFRKTLEKIEKDKPRPPQGKGEQPMPARLPPFRPNEILQGKRGGLYYVNRAGKKMYLTAAQCRRCVSGERKIKGCPPAKKKKCPLTKQELKAQNRKLSKEVKRLRQSRDSKDKTRKKTARQKRERNERTLRRRLKSNR